MRYEAEVRKLLKDKKYMFCVHMKADGWHGFLAPYVNKYEPRKEKYEFKAKELTKILEMALEILEEL